jgi:glycosyltransferase involved in cell wall biosynthesis
MTARSTDVMLVGDLASPHVRRLATALRDHGLTIEVACFEGDPIPGIETHRLGSRPVHQDRRYAAAVLPLARLLRRRRPGVVHAHYLSSYGLLAALAIRLAHPIGRRPALVQTTWGSDLLVTARTSFIRRFLATVALRSADLMTGDSADLESEARRLAPRARFHRFVFGPAADRFEIARQPDRVVLSGRRLDPDMRVDLVIAAFRSATSDRGMDGWRLVVAGDGTQAAELRRSVADDSSIVFVGYLDAAALSAQLARGAIFVSVPVSDATSAFVLEAMAAGVVPVVNDLPANREWVDASIGEIVPADPTVDVLAAAIARAARRSIDPESVRSRVRAVAWDAEVDRLISAYRGLSPRAVSGQERD